MPSSPARAALIPPEAWPGLRMRLAIVLAMSLVMGLGNWALLPSHGPLPRRLDVAMVYTCAISLSTWFMVDVGRFVLRGPLRSTLPNCWPSGWRAGLLLAVGTGSGYALGTWVGDSYAGRSTLALLWHDPSRFTGLLVSSLVISALFVVFFYQRGRAEALARQAREAELRLLQSQLEPHMLFNTLANLRVLIGLDPLRAQAMLDRLINFLRATLSATRTATHPLAAEFAHLDDYLALMAVRMGPRLTVQLHLPDELRALPLPPLLLQPLVENAIKHGLEPKVEGGRIEVQALREGRLLRLSVRDTGVGLSGAAATATTSAATTAATTAGTGFGLEQVRARLATLHGARATLTLQAAADGEGGVMATLILPIE